MCVYIYIQTYVYSYTASPPAAAAVSAAAFGLATHSLDKVVLRGSAQGSTCHERFHKLFQCVRGFVHTSLTCPSVPLMDKCLLASG